MTPIVTDPSLYCKFENCKLAGLNRCFMEDFLRTGTDVWPSRTDATLEIFNLTGNEDPLLSFTEMNITDNEDVFQIDQYFFMTKIEQTPYDAEFYKLTSMRIKFAWLKNTRLNLAREILQTVQATRAMFHQDITKHCKLLNKAVNNAYDNKASIRIPELGFDSL